MILLRTSCWLHKNTHILDWLSDDAQSYSNAHSSHKSRAVNPIDKGQPLVDVPVQANMRVLQHERRPNRFENSYASSYHRLPINFYNIHQSNQLVSGWTWRHFEPSHDDGCHELPFTGLKYRVSGFIRPRLGSIRAWRGGRPCQTVVDRIQLLQNQVVSPIGLKCTMGLLIQPTWCRSLFRHF